MLFNPPMALIISIVARSMSEMQSHRILPCGVRRSCARWPMPKAGNVTMEMRLGSSSRHAFMLRLASVSSVVQPWPGGGTYCRSSSQIGQADGGFSDGSYCVPQVVQMKAGMAGTRLRSMMQPAAHAPRAFAGLPRHRHFADVLGHLVSLLRRRFLGDRRVPAVHVGILL